MPDDFVVVEEEVVAVEFGGGDGDEEVEAEDGGGNGGDDGGFHSSDQWGVEVVRGALPDVCSIGLHDAGEGGYSNSLDKLVLTQEVCGPSHDDRMHSAEEVGVRTY